MIKDFLINAAKGFAMGAANVIPGVSGGTIAVVTGIYERLIVALKSLDLATLKLALKGRLAEAIKRCDGLFLAAIVFGALVSLLSLAKFLKWAFDVQPMLVWGFFFGLILASIYYVGQMVKKWSGDVIGLAAFGAAIAIAMAFLTPASQNSNIFYLLLCGVAGMCSMIVPGLSGSFVLLLMGNYELIVLDGVNALRQLDFGTALPLLIPVGLGAVLGLVLLARVLSWLFARHHDRAMGMVTGFIAGSLALIYPWKTPSEIAEFDGKEKVISYAYNAPDFASITTWQTVGLVVAGVLLMVLTERLGKKS